jgi:hypothetical protein
METFMKPGLSQAAQAEIARIARSVLHLETLETRNRDDLDFSEQSVWAIREALEAAYLAGMADAYEATRR